MDEYIDKWMYKLMGYIDKWMNGKQQTSLCYVIFCFVFHFIRSIPKVNVALIIL